nr:hypothetical protein CFP56_04538 [Quercus suber]
MRRILSEELTTLLGDQGDVGTQRGRFVDHILSEYRSGQRTVDLLCIDVLQFPVENKVVAFCAQADCCLFAQQDKGEYIAVFLPARKKEAVGVDAVGDGAAEKGDPVEYNWRLVGVAKDELARDIKQDGKGDKGAEGEQNDLPCRRSGGQFTKRVDEIVEETHGVQRLAWSEALSRTLLSLLGCEVHGKGETTATLLFGSNH